MTIFKKSFKYSKIYFIVLRKMAKSDQGKVVAILSYFLVGIIWYFVDEKVKGDKLAKFHVKQALNLMIISVAVSVVGMFLFFLIWIVPLVQLALFVLWIIGLISAINGNMKEIPIIGGLAEKYLNF